MCPSSMIWWPKADETLTVSLANLDNTTATVTLPTAPATVTINDNDMAVLTLTPSALTVTEGGTATFTVSVDIAVQGGFTVAASTTTAGTATEGADYTAVNSQMLTFAGIIGETQTVTVATLDDAVSEVAETLTVSLADLGATMATVTLPTAPAMVTIADNDAAGLTLTPSALTVTEGGTATFTMSVDMAVGVFTVAASTTTAGTATSGADYTALNSHMLTFAGTIGETQILTVTTLDDAVVEGAETLTVSLAIVASTLPVTLPTALATVTINDNDTAALTLTPDNPTVNEDDGTATFTVSVDNAVQGGFTVAASTTTAGTATSVEDYTAVNSQMLTFAGTIGETQTLTVAINDDAVAEAAETLMVSLATVAATTATVTLPVGTVTVTINDDDTAALTLTPSALTVTEGGTATFTVSVDIAVQGGFTVAASTTAVTATEGADYTAVNSQMLTFAGIIGETRTVTVVTMDDTAPEFAETLTVSLADLSTTAMVTLPDAATVTIMDNDSRRPHADADHPDRD